MTRYLRVDGAHAPEPSGYCTCGKIWPCIDAYGSIDAPKLVGLRLPDFRDGEPPQDYLSRAARRGFTDGN